MSGRSGGIGDQTNFFCVEKILSFGERAWAGVQRLDMKRARGGVIM